MNCIEGLQAMWAHVDFSSKKNGIPDVIIVCLHVPHVGSLYFLLLYCYIINLLINREQRNLDPFSWWTSGLDGSTKKANIIR